MSNLNEKILALSVMAKDEASAALSRVDANLRSLGLRAEGTGRSLGSMQAIMGNVAGYLAAGVAVGTLTGFLTDSVKAAIDEEAGIKRLGQSLQANVPQWKGNTAAIEATIAARQRLGFSDGDLRDSLARTVAITHDESKAFEIQATAMDLARFRGISLADATQALITVEAGRYRGLAQLGIVLKEGATQTEALAAVQKVAGGQAEAFGHTTAGAMQEAGVAVENLKEDIGAKLLPVLGEAARGLTTLLGPQKQSNDNWTLLGMAIHSITEPGSLPTALRQIQDTAAHLDELGRQSFVASEQADRLTGSTKDVDEAARRAAMAEGSLGNYIDGQAAAAHAATAANLALVVSLDAIDRKYRVSTAPFTNPRLKGTADADRRNAFDSGGDQAAFDQHAASTQAAADAAAAARAAAAVKIHQGVSSAITQAAKDRAAAERDAFSQSKSAADSYFDSEHRRIVAAIDDAHRKANEQIAVERRSIDARLQEQRRLNAAPVTAAEKQLASTQNFEQLRNLTEARDAAAQAVAANMDPTQNAQLARSLRDANEALDNFQAQLNIETLKARQAAGDDAAQLDATAANTALDGKQKASDAQYRADRAAEDARYKAQKKAFDADLTALEKHLLNRKHAHENYIAQIEALYDHYHLAIDGGGHVTSDKATPAPAAKAAHEAGTTIVLQVDGQTMWRVLSKHAFDESRIYNLSQPGSGF